MSLGSSVVAFAAVAGVLTITPGLDTALVLRAALTDGRRHAFATALGVNAGVLVWAVGAAAGVSTLVTMSATAYGGLRLVGAVYMIVLGVRMLAATWRRRRPGAAAAATGHGPAPGPGPAPDTGGAAALGSSFRRGLFTNLLNPKVGAFYVALLPQFIPPGAPAAPVGTLLGLVHNAEGLLWFSLLIAAASSARRLLSRPGCQRFLDRLTGSVLIGFGLNVARSHRAVA